MVASAKIAYHVKRQAEYGVKEAGEVTVDMATVRKRKRDIVDSFRGGSEGRLKKAENVTVVRGKARFVGMKEVEVQSTKGETERLKAEWVFVNVGCRPAPLAIPGADTVDVLDSTSIMELAVVPEHLVVIGGGYVGLEFAQMFRRFGSKVTIVQRGGQLLGREDEDIAEDVKKILLEEDGVDVMLNSRVEKAEKIDDGKAKLVVKTENGEDEVLCSHILAAAGRVPNTNDLGLEKTGVELGKDGFVKVNEKLQTSVDGIFVMGDVKGGPAFTHISYDDFRILKGNILDNRTLTTTARLVPYTVFIDPQLGRIGHTEASAKAQGLKYRVAKMPMAWVARALEMDETRGMMKVLVEEEGKGDQILGCAILGIDGGEVMSMIQIAVMGGVKWQALRDGVFAHPLLAESLNNLFGSLEG